MTVEQLRAFVASASALAVVNGRVVKRVPLSSLPVWAFGSVHFQIDVPVLPGDEITGRLEFSDCDVLGEHGISIQAWLSLRYTTCE